MESISRLCLDGVGRMGFGMSERWRQAGIDVVRYDFNREVSDVDSLEALVNSMPAGHRVIWLMLPMQAYEPTIATLLQLLTTGDMVIDGGNTHWAITQGRHKLFAEIGVHYVDVGTSGGVYGQENGYALMVGATPEEYQALMPVLQALAPSTHGLVHAGPSGAGHFAKEVHNGIEYAMMAALAEGHALLAAAGEGNPLGVSVSDVDEVMASWQNGTIVQSFLLTVMMEAVAKPGFANIAPVALDSGEGRWTLSDAISLGIPVPAIAAALNSRLASQGKADDSSRVIAAVRNQFGGHEVVIQS